MSELIYYLKPNGVKDGSLIEIPIGTVTIGRGPFLRCTEKRVSRNHAELTLTLDGDLSIIPKNVNPTYHRDNTSTSVYKPLEKEKLFILQPGDSISLLPDTLTYEIIVKHKIGRINASLDENMADDFKLTAINEAEDINKNGQGKYFGAEVDNAVENKTRELPSWIIEMAENTPLEEKNSTSKKKNLQVKKVPVHENKITEINEKLKKPNQSLGKDEQKENVCEVSKGNPEVVKAGTSATSKEKRLACEFGEKCYRKNPNHKLQFSHPGDDDYDQTLKGVSDDDDRPECEYGTECYRKNPDHKKAYKHSAKPKRKAVIKAKRRKENETENDDEDDWYDESFIDDSDEYDPKRDDANYSSDDDDMEVLNKEAKAFIKNKKL